MVVFKPVHGSDAAHQGGSSRQSSHSGQDVHYDPETGQLTSQKLKELQDGVVKCIPPVVVSMNRLKNNMEAAQGHGAKHTRAEELEMLTSLYSHLDKLEQAWMQYIHDDTNHGIGDHFKDTFPLLPNLFVKPRLSTTAYGSSDQIEDMITEAEIILREQLKDHKITLEAPERMVAERERMHEFQKRRKAQAKAMESLNKEVHAIHTPETPEAALRLHQFHAVEAEKVADLCVEAIHNHSSGHKPPPLSPKDAQVEDRKNAGLLREFFLYADTMAEVFQKALLDVGAKHFPGHYHEHPAKQVFSREHLQEMLQISVDCVKSASAHMQPFYAHPAKATLPHHSGPQQHTQR